jgi:predicted nucleic acid-binding protein
LLVAIRSLPGHTFWPDSISVADDAFFASELLSSHSRVTDSYLLALAHVNGGRLATMDTKLATEPVPGARATIEVI